jgi:hypothetical protein
MGLHWLNTRENHTASMVLIPFAPWEISMLTLLGRVRSVREAGKNLLFIDIVHNEARLQVMANLGGLQKDVGYSTEELQRFRKLIKPGDYFCEFESFVAIILFHMTDSWESIPRLSGENLSRRTLPLLDRVT